MIRIAFCFFFVAAALLSTAQTEVSAKFIGTWQADKMDSEDMTEADSIEFEEMKAMLVFIFEEEGVFKIPMPEELLEEMDEAVIDLEDKNGSWKLEEGGKITICFDADDPEDCEILDYIFIDENRLILSDGEEGVHFIRN